MRNHPLVQLTLARAREFYREPEAVFWVFGFPVVLAFALGIAFRNHGPDTCSSEVARRGDRIARGDQSLGSVAARCRLSREAAALAGHIALLVLPGDCCIPLRFHQGGSQLARLQVNDLLRPGAGATRYYPGRSDPRRSRYIGFLIQTCSG
jgi:hypothetical protein